MGKRTSKPCKPGLQTQADPVLCYCSSELHTRTGCKQGFLHMTWLGAWLLAEGSRPECKLCFVHSAAVGCCQLAPRKYSFIQCFLRPTMVPITAQGLGFIQPSRPVLYALSMPSESVCPHPLLTVARGSIYFHHCRHSSSPLPRLLMGARA